jgi:hypothetical protein
VPLAQLCEQQSPSELQQSPSSWQLGSCGVQAPPVPESPPLPLPPLLPPLLPPEPLSLPPLLPPLLLAPLLLPPLLPPEPPSLPPLLPPLLLPLPAAHLPESHTSEQQSE